MPNERGLGREGVEAIERWFIRRGVPHLIEGYSAREDVWTRAVPVLVVAYVAGGLNALDLSWSLGRNLVALAGVLAILAATWMLTNRWRHRPALGRPREVGPVELAVFVLGPALPALALGQPGDAVQAVLEGLAVLAVVYLATSYGLVPVVRWAGARAWSLLTVLVDLVSRALPLLLLFMTFLFVNAEVWQVGADLRGVAYAATLGVFFVVGAAFVLIRLPGTLGVIARFPAWSDVAALAVGTPAESEAGRLAASAGGVPPVVPLTRRQRLNVGLVAVFSQGMQITAVAAAIGTFFVLFGTLTITVATTESWTGVAPDVLVSWELDGRELAVTGELLRVAGFLAAFSAMYFTVVLTTDATYRQEFRDDVADEIRQAFAVRLVYLRARAALG